MQETLGHMSSILTGEDPLEGFPPLEEEMTTHPGSILAWKIQTDEPGVLQSMGSQAVDTT